MNLWIVVEMADGANRRDDIAHSAHISPESAQTTMYQLAQSDASLADHLQIVKVPDRVVQRVGRILKDY